jgi:type II secretion system protein G
VPYLAKAITRKKQGDNIMYALRGKMGFTLVEILMVVIILGLIAALVIPRIANTKAEAEEKACISNQANLNAALQRYKFDNGSYPDHDTYADLAADTNFVGPYVDDVPDCPGSGTMSYDKTAGTVSCDTHSK